MVAGVISEIDNSVWALYIIQVIVVDDSVLYGKCSKISEHFSLTILKKNVGWQGRNSRVRKALKSTWIYKTVLKSPWKLNLHWKVLEKHYWILPFTGGFNTVFGGLNHNKIVVPLFGAANAAPNKDTQFYTYFLKLISLVMHCSISEVEF